MMALVIWYNQGPADPETVYANIPGAGTQTGEIRNFLALRTITPVRDGARMGEIFRDMFYVG